MNHFLLLPLILTGLLSVTFFLPGQGHLKESAISTELPKRLNGWKGTARQAGLKEKNTLSKDTLFRKMDYWRLGDPRDHYSLVPNNQRVHLSVVFSGHDVNNSIHRPERCLPAQGHFNMTSRDIFLPLPELDVKVPIKRLSSKQKISLGQTLEGEKEASYELDSVTYYVFVGHAAMTQNHIDRTAIDIKDRLLGGYDQRWAFISMSLPFGDQPFPNIGTITEEEADRILSEMMTKLIEESVDLGRIKHGFLPL